MKFEGSFLDVVLDIAEHDPKFALHFIPRDVREAKVELAELRARLKAVVEAGNAMRPFMQDADMVGETQFEKAVLHLWKVLDRAAPAEKEQ